MTPTLDDVIKQLNNIELDNDTVPMRTGKAKGWLGEYHWVIPAMLRSQEVHVKKRTDPEKREWCEQQFGRSGHRWYENHNRFYFKDEADMTMFILRWA